MPVLWPQGIIDRMPPTLPPAVIDAAIDYVLRNEGLTYVDAVDDRGGPTRYGITLVTLTRWRGQQASAQDVASLTLAEARSIYRVRYWAPLRLGELADMGLATAVLDIAVLCGPSTAAKLLQRAVGAKGDGILGSRTLAATNTAPATETMQRLHQGLVAYLTAIAQRDATQAKWLPGWLQRARRMLTLPLGKSWMIV